MTDGSSSGQAPRHVDRAGIVIAIALALLAVCAVATPAFGDDIVEKKRAIDERIEALSSTLATQRASEQALRDEIDVVTTRIRTLEANVGDVSLQLSTLEQDLAHVTWAPRVNLSARTGRHLDKLVPALETALESWDQRIPTGKFNAFLAELIAEHPHPLRGGKQPRILFGTQASTRPPTFVLFVSGGELGDDYLRYLENRLRETYDFMGNPIHFVTRKRGER